MIEKERTQWKKEDISINRAHIIVKADLDERAREVLEEAGTRLKKSKKCGGK